MCDIIKYTNDNKIGRIIVYIERVFDYLNIA